MPRIQSALLPSSIALAGLLLAGCASDSTSTPGWAGTVDTLPGGRIVVTNSGAAAWTDADRPVFREELRIGSMMDEGPHTLGQVRDLLVDDAGRIYVLESQAQEIRVFGSDGGYVRTIGREGEGPGELKNAAAMGWGPGGILRVVDFGNSRISDFDADGTFIEGHRQQGGFVMYPWPGVFESNGGLVHVSPSVSEDSFEPVLVRYSPDMQPADTMAMPEYAGDEEFFELQSEDGHMMASVPFGAGLSWDLDPAGAFWVAPNTATYEVSRISFSGDTLLTVRRPVERIPVTSAEVDSAVSTMSWFTEQGGRIDRSKFPSVKPAINRIFAPGNGNLYVVPINDEFGSGYLSTGTALDVFDPEGRYLGRLALPEGMRTANPQPVFTGDRVVAVVRDELDVPYVVRFRLAPAGVLGEG